MFILTGKPGVVWQRKSYCGGGAAVTTHRISFDSCSRILIFRPYVPGVVNAPVSLNSVAVATVSPMSVMNGPLSEMEYAPDPPSNAVPVMVSVRRADDVVNAAGVMDVITGTGGSGGGGAAADRQPAAKARATAMATVNPFRIPGAYAQTCSRPVVIY